MRTSSLRCQLVSVTVSVALLAGGCTQTRVDRIAKYEPGSPDVLARPRDVGLYKVKYATVGEKELKTLPGSQRIVSPNRLVGFARSESGETLAVAGQEHFVLALPPDTRYCIWYGKSQGPSDVSTTTTDVLPAIAIAALIGGILVGMVYLDAKESHYERKHHHHYDDSTDSLFE